MKSKGLLCLFLAVVLTLGVVSPTAFANESVLLEQATEIALESNDEQIDNENGGAEESTTSADSSSNDEQSDNQNVGVEESTTSADSSSNDEQTDNETGGVEESTTSADSSSNDEQSNNENVGVEESTTSADSLSNDEQSDNETGGVEESTTSADSSSNDEQSDNENGGALDTQALSALIEEALAIDTSICTEQSQNALTTALENASTVLREGTSQEAIDNACLSLELAINALTVDKTKQVDRIIASVSKVWSDSTSIVTDDWKVVDMAILGRADELFADQAEKRLYISQAINRIKPTTVTDYERVLLALTALGIDGTRLGEYRAFYDKNGGRVENLIECISAFEAKSLSVNASVFGLLAYDSGSYSVPEGTWSRDSLISYLVSNTLENGGWNYTPKGNADVDLTSMAISALAPYAERPEVALAIEGGLSALSSAQNSLGGYASWGSVNSNSAAMVVIALASLGKDADTDPAFVKEDNQIKSSVLDSLLSFETADHQFGYTNAKTVNAFSTEQGFRAMAAYRKLLDTQGACNPYYFGKPDDVQKWEDQPVALSLSITAKPKKLEYAVNEALDTKGLSVTVTFSDGSTLKPTVDNLTFTGFSSSTSGKRTVKVAFENTSDVFTITVKKNDSVSQTTSSKVYLRVADPKGKTYLKKTAIELEEGETAFSILGRSGLDYIASAESEHGGVYVEQIEGLAEFDEGVQSGWMYRVNGKFPTKSSSLYKLKKGDYVEWLYTRDYGKDVGDTYVVSTSLAGLSTLEKADDSADKKKAKQVTDLIASLEEGEKLSEEAVVKARQAYDLLTESQKKLVSNLEKLTNAEKALEEQKLLEKQQKAEEQKLLEEQQLLENQRLNNYYAITKAIIDNLKLIYKMLIAGN